MRNNTLRILLYIFDFIIFIKKTNFDKILLLKNYYELLE